MAKKIRKFLFQSLLMVIGSAIYAVSVNSFAVPNHIAPGGMTGVATMLNYLFSTPVGAVYLILNVPIVLWAIIDIGYKLVLKTAAAIVVSSLCIDFLTFLPVYRGDPILAAVFEGVLEGVGLSLVFMTGATTGGTDMIARLVNSRVRFLSIGKLMLAVDGLIILASAFVFHSAESAMYACIVVFVATKIIDAILYGADVGTGKIFFVISAKSEEIARRIMEELSRGVTFLKSRGGFTGKEGEMIMCAVRRFEISRIQEIIRQTDKEAFVIVGDAGEITGEGFKAIKGDDKTLKELMSRNGKGRRKKESDPKELPEKEG